MWWYTRKLTSLPDDTRVTSYYFDGDKPNQYEGQFVRGSIFHNRLLASFGSEDKICSTLQECKQWVENQYQLYILKNL